MECYRNLGMNYREILLFIGLMHSYFLNLRQLTHILRSGGRGRRMNRSDPQEVCRCIACIEEELCSSGSTVG